MKIIILVPAIIDVRSIAQVACKRARDIASISIVIICGHVNEEDPCCDDDVDGATIEVRWKIECIERRISFKVSGLAG